MSRFLNNLTSAICRKPRTARPARRSSGSTNSAAARPFEALEDRVLMWAAPIPDGISFSSGTVRINCGSGNDASAVFAEADKLRVTLSHTTYIQVDINTVIKTTLPEPDKFYDLASVTKINFYGNAGNDSFQNNTAIPSTALGGDGSDSLTGGGGADALYGSAGDDDLNGRGGNDTLDAGTGDDTLEGGAGNDSLTGGDGNDDYVFAGRFLGADTLTEPPTSGQDKLDMTDLGKILTSTTTRTVTSTRLLTRSGLVSRTLTPLLLTGAKLDLSKSTTQTVVPTHLTLTFSNGSAIEDVYGTGAADTITGNARNNHLYGQGGNDTIRGEAGDDWVYGGAGNDVLFGSFGSDHLNGDAGNDRLYGAADGKSWLYGGAGDDTLVTLGGDDSDYSSGGAGFDSFWVDSEATETISDLSAAEQAAGHEHRIESFYECHKVSGNTDQNLGAPGRSRNGMSLADPIPKSAVGYTNFAGSPLFAAGGPTKDDLRQGGPIGDCYWMSTVAAVARVNPDRIRQLVVDLGDGTYAVHFRGNDGGDQFVRVDADLPTSAGALVYARLGAGNSIWSPIVEKAWTFFRDNKGTYASIEYWHPEYLHSPYDALNTTVHYENTVASYWNGSTPGSGKAVLQAIKGELDAGLAVTLSGPHPLDGTTQMVADNYHSGAHAYMVESVAADFSSITIRNPYATQGPNGDGYTTISAEMAFYACYNFTSLYV